MAIVLMDPCADYGFGPMPTPLTNPSGQPIIFTTTDEAADYCARTYTAMGNVVPELATAQNREQGIPASQVLAELTTRARTIWATRGWQAGDSELDGDDAVWYYDGTDLIGHTADWQDGDGDAVEGGFVMGRQFFRVSADKLTGVRG